MIHSAECDGQVEVLRTSTAKRADPYPIKRRRRCLGCKSRFSTLEHRAEVITNAFRAFGKEHERLERLTKRLREERAYNVLLVKTLRANRIAIPDRALLPVAPTSGQPTHSEGTCER